MAVFNEPTKWQTSLVNSGDANVIPQSTPVGTGEASFDDGFPQITQIPIGAGGIAPDRKDFNGLFKILGDWIFFNQNGGVPSYNADYDYVAGRVVSYNDNIYKCVQANGVSSTVVTPDSNTEYWQRLDNFVRSVNGVDADAEGNVRGFFPSSSFVDFTGDFSATLNTPNNGGERRSYFTAPTNGYVCFRVTSNHVNALIGTFSEAITSQISIPSDGSSYDVFVPITKGSKGGFVVICSNWVNVNQARFYYAIGEEPN